MLQTLSRSNYNSFELPAGVSHYDKGVNCQFKEFQKLLIFNGAGLVREHSERVQKDGDSNCFQVRKNGVAVHAWDEGHRVDWEGAKIPRVGTTLPEEKGPRIKPSG